MCKRLKSSEINSARLQAGGIDSLESISGLLNRLQIRALAHPHGQKCEMNIKTFLETKYFPS